MLHVDPTVEVKRALDKTLKACESHKSQTCAAVTLSLGVNVVTPIYALQQPSV